MHTWGLLLLICMISPPFQFLLLLLLLFYALNFCLTFNHGIFSFTRAHLIWANWMNGNAWWCFVILRCMISLSFQFLLLLFFFFLVFNFFVPLLTMTFLVLFLSQKLDFANELSIYFYFRNFSWLMINYIKFVL